MKLRKRQLLASSAIILSLFLYRSVDPSLYAISTEPDQKMIAQVPINDIPVANYRTVLPPLSATAYVVTDEASGVVLASQNADTLYAPASTTKLMTALVAREEYRPGSVLTVQFDQPVGGTMIGLRNGEQYVLEDLLQASLINSGNDAAAVIATNYPGGEAAFIDKMNQRAQELGMTSTRFSNVTGFDQIDHYSTARDLAILAREAMRDSLISSIVKTPQSLIQDISGKRKITIYSTNALLGVDPRVIGVKTGTTEEAGEVLITALKDQQRTLLFVVLGSTSRYTDTQALIEQIPAQYTWYQPEEVLRQQALVE